MCYVFNAILALGLLVGLAAPASTAAPAAAGVGCTSTRSCTPAHGGSLITTPAESCTEGIPVRSAGSWYMLVAGHCAHGGRTWYHAGRVVGTLVRWQYGGLGTDGPRATGDVAAIRYAPGWAPRSRVLVVGASGPRPQALTRVRDARLGERVCATLGRTGATRCGRVTSTSTTLRYASPGLPARTITGLVLVKGICVNPGDSGAPVFAGSTAFGIVVAKSGSGCYAWYTKLPAVLAAYRLRLG